MTCKDIPDVLDAPRELHHCMQHASHSMRYTNLTTTRPPITPHLGCRPLLSLSRDPWLLDLADWKPSEGAEDRMEEAIKLLLPCGREPARARPASDSTSWPQKVVQSLRDQSYVCKHELE